MPRSTGFVVGDTRKIERLRKKYNSQVNRILTGLAVDGRKRCQTLARSRFTSFPSDSGNTLSSELRQDTGGIIASFYVVAPGMDDYEARRDDMVNAYAKRYKAPHINARIAPKKEVGHHQAAFGSASRVMAFWEYGHNNKWTGQYEKNPILRPVREELKTTAARRFANMMKK